MTRARYPDAEAAVDRAGVRVCCEVYGAGQPTMLLPPAQKPSATPGRR